MSVSELVKNRLSRMKRGIPFSIEKFYSLGSATAVQKTMSRLTKVGEVVRVAKGIYSRPKPLASIPSITMAATAEDVVKTWAKAHGYKMVPQGLEAAYRLGLQTQAPVKTVFWCSGPSRNFRVGNQEVEVKHTSRSKLQWAHKPEGELLRGLMFSSPEHTTVQQLSVALRRLNLSSEEKLTVVNKLLNSHSLAVWTPQLTHLKHTLLS